MPNQDKQVYITKQKKLIDFLISQQLLNQSDADGLLADLSSAEKEIDIENLIMDKKVMPLEKFVQAKATFLNIPYMDLTDREVPEEVLNNVPAEVAENYKVICFDRHDNKLSIGLTEPNDFHAIEAIDFLATKQDLIVEYYLISQASFLNIFKQYKKFNKEISSALEIKAVEEKDEEKTISEEEEDNNFDFIVKNAPVAKIVNVIIVHAVEAGASDIHIEPMPKETRVRYRIDGLLHSSLTLPKNIHDSLIARIKVLSKLKLDETRIPQGGRIRMTINKKEIDFRVSVLPLMGEEKVVLRVLDTTKGILTLEQLGYSPLNIDTIKRNIKKTTGIILITGPTGSGKSTTLYSLLFDLNKEGVNIVTLEDPVEYYIEGVNQSQIRPEIGFTFAAGLRSLLRQDPDIMMVGEIRDNETAELAIHSALTGHLVLSTLHTNDAVGAIPRLLDMNIEPFLLGSVMDLVIAQRLARRLCSYCKKEMVISPEFKTELKGKIADIPPEILKSYLPEFTGENFKLFEKVGCVHCNKTGYKSRVAISEVLDVNKDIRDFVINRKGVLSLEKIRESQPFTNMQQDGLIKVMQGLTTLEEVYRVIMN